MAQPVWAYSRSKSSYLKNKEEKNLKLVQKRSIERGYNIPATLSSNYYPGTHTEPNFKNGFHNQALPGYKTFIIYNYSRTISYLRNIILEQIIYKLYHNNIYKLQYNSYSFVHYLIREFWVPFSGEKLLGHC